MEEGMRESTSMIKSMDLAYTHGKMVGSMQVNGKMVNSMAKEYTKI